MTKVFVAGSRRLSRLPGEVKLRVEAIVRNGFTVLVGDANGADKAFQQYLADRSYPAVVVYFTGTACRNNLGSWPGRSVAAPPGAKGRAFFAAKDMVMVSDANFGLMLWDGESQGTLNDIKEMLSREKPVVMYWSPGRTSNELRSVGDLDKFLTAVTPTQRAVIHGEAGRDARDGHSMPSRRREARQMELPVR